MLPVPSIPSLVLIVLLWLGASASALAFAYRRDLRSAWREPVLRAPVLILESDDWGYGPEVQAERLEESGDAVDAGVASRDFNRIDTRACRFVSARAEDVVAGRVRGVDARFSPDAIVVDPPREGCPESVLKGVLESHRPRVLVYVSCNPLTLARDLATLSKARLVGPAHAPYRLDTVRPLDMFPHTPHLEVVATLVRAG